MADSRSVNGALLSSFPATQWCKVRPCAIDIQSADLPGAFRLDARFLYNQTSDSNSVNGTFFTGLLATQRDRVRSYVMYIHGVRFCYEIGTSASTFRLNTRFLHSQMSNSNSVNGALFTRF